MWTCETLVPVGEAEVVVLPDRSGYAVIHRPGYELAAGCAIQKPRILVETLRTVGEL